MKIISYITLFLILLLLVSSITFNSSLLTNFNQQTTNNPNMTLPDKTSEIQNHVQAFSDIENTNFNLPSNIGISFTGVSEIALINNDNTVITYNSNISPNLENVINDLLEGFANVDEINIEGCINPDQLAVNYQTKTCTAEDCYDRFGNHIEINQRIEEIVNREDIEFCTNQDLGYLTFNFSIDPSTKLVRDEVLFMEIETIYLGANKYNELRDDSNLDYYFDNNLFVQDLNIGENIIVPRIIHSRFKRNNFRQKIIIQRYNTSGVSSSEGNLAELFFRPGQLFLTAENADGNISNITTTADTSLFSDNYSVRVVKQGDNKTAKCVISTGGKVNIIDGGVCYQNSSVEIEQDNGLFGGSFDVTINNNSKRLIMKSRSDVTNEAARAVWLLSRPQNLTPQGITKQNKITQGYILNFSNQSPVNNINKAVSELPAYSKVSPGTIISPIQFDLVTTTVKDILSANNCQYLIDDNGSVYKTCNDNIIVNGQPLSYYSRFLELFNGQIDINQFLNFFRADGGTTSSFFINEQTYSEYPPNLLKAVNKFPVFADPKNLNNGGEVVVFTFELNLTINQNRFQTVIGVSPNPEITDTQIADDVILDGAVEWQEINTFSETAAFRKEYFTQANLSQGTSTITRISDLNLVSGGVSFIEPVLGKLGQVNITTANYSNITLPNFDSSKLIDFNSSTLVTESQGASIGQNAKCLLTFTKEGTSIIIETLQIIDAGQDFISGTFGILGSGLSAGLEGTIEGIEITSINDEYIFEAVTTTIDNNSPISPVNIVNNLDFNINYGLIINPVQNKSISLTNPEIIEGGQNYNVGISVFINQFDITGESVFGLSYNPENITDDLMRTLPYVVVNGVSSLNILQPSPYPLFSDISVGISYNFWEDSPGTFENSPQQLIFYGDFIDGTSPPNVIGDPANDFSQFLLNNKFGDSAFTNAEYLVSLQIPSYYYQNSTENFPIIEPYEGLVLKRFIPYSQFSPPLFNPGEKIPTKNPTATYVNYNYCQFIPFGAKNLYNRQFQNIEEIPNF